MTLALRDADVAEVIGNATRQSFEKTVDLCLEEAVDALMIAGDLYDGDLRSMKTAVFFGGQMRRLTEAGIDVQLHVNIRTKFHEDDPIDYNVLAEIPGVDPKLKEEIVMMGAHLDSWHSGTGATDNASGVSVMLEAMRILKALEIQPRRTIRILLWSHEEGGLRGSRGYVRNHMGNPRDGTTPAYDKFSVYFNQDYGPGQYRGIYLQGNEHVRQTFAAWMEPFRDLGMTTISTRSVGSTGRPTARNRWRCRSLSIPRADAATPEPT